MFPDLDPEIVQILNRIGEAEARAFPDPELLAYEDSSTPSRAYAFIAAVRRNPKTTPWKISDTVIVTLSGQIQRPNMYTVRKQVIASARCDEEGLWVLEEKVIYPHTIASGAIQKQYAVFKSLPSGRVLQGKWYDDINAALRAIEQVHGKLAWAPDVTDEWIKQQKTAPHY